MVSRINQKAKYVEDNRGRVTKEGEDRRGRRLSSTTKAPKPLHPCTSQSSTINRKRNRASGTGGLRTPLPHPPALHKTSEPTLLQPNHAAQIARPDLALGVSRAAAAVLAGMISRARMGLSLAAFRVGKVEARGSRSGGGGGG